MLTIIEECGLGIARRGPRRGGSRRWAAAAPLTDHVDLLVRLVGQLRTRGHLPLLGHEAARHGGARISLRAAASRDRRTEKKREKRKSGAPGERRSRSLAYPCGCDGRVWGDRLIWRTGWCARRGFDRPHKLYVANLERDTCRFVARLPAAPRHAVTRRCHLRAPTGCAARRLQAATLHLQLGELRTRPRHAYTYPTLYTSTYNCWRKDTDDRAP